MMAEPRFWSHKANAVSLALVPLSWLYRGLETTRRKFAQPQHPGKPVICVGNLTAGGAGKTPSVQWLLTQLTARGMKPAVLSRGYGGTQRGPLKVDSSAHDAAMVGDEPLMLAQSANVYIGADRMASLRLAVADGHDVLVKDDGFQNPSMAHHFNLIVIDGESGIGNGRLLPAGPLRQSLSVALARLDAAVIIGAARHPSLGDIKARLARLGKPVFTAHIQATKTGAGAVHGFCGIAKPEKFRASLEAQGYRVEAMTCFADHHEFSEADAQRLLSSRLPLITTQKDMARLIGADANSARGQLAKRTDTLPIELIVDDGATLYAAIEESLAAKQANRLYKSY